MESYNWISFIGIFMLIGLAWLMSAERRSVSIRVIAWGLALQFIFAAFIFWIPAGSKFFLWINTAVVKVLDSASAGTFFLFGRVAIPPGAPHATGETSLGFSLAFQALPTIVFFAALMSLLYFFNIMPQIIRGFARLFTRLMRVSGAESLAAASNIFVGVESSLTIRPFLEKMTQSELTTVLTAGMATVASNVLALYVFILQGQFPNIAGHLVSASILSAPAALIMAKVLMPETDRPETLGMHVKPVCDRENNWIEAVINGARAGVKLIVGISALLLAFLGLVALLDLIIGGVGNQLNNLLGVGVDWSLKGLLGYLFYPITLIIGIPVADAFEMAKIIGERTVVTEVTAYQDLAALMAQNGLEHARSSVIGTYALCGFAHIASLAIFVGGISALAPSRKTDLSKLAPRALLAATLACLLTAAIAGTFFNDTSILLN